MSGRGPGWWRLWIAALLRAYPRRFRARFGADLAAQYPPPDRAMRGAVRAGADLIRGGMGARADDALRAMRRRAAAIRDGLVLDLRHAARALVRQRGFTAAIVLTLGLAAGLNAAVFGILDATLLRPLPYPGERSLVAIGSVWHNYPFAAVSLPEYVDYAQRARSFASIAVFSNSSVNLTSSNGPAERVQGARATPSFFEVLGVPPLLGRTFTADEDLHDVPVVVISHSMWLRRFGGDRAVVGRDLLTDAGALTIVGVMPPEFGIPSALTEVWMPMNLVPGDAGSRGAHNRQVIARLRDGVTLDQARDDMRRIAAQLAQEHPAFYPAGSGWDVAVRDVRERMVGTYRPALQVLMTAVLLVLLIACANVANLMVARAAGRGHETAMRAALGASRARLVRQSAIEGALAGAVGGVAGVVAGTALLASIDALLPDGLPRPDSMLTDVRVIVYTILLSSAAAGVTAGITAFGAAHRAAGEGLRSARVTSAAARVRATLTLAQVALAVMLLVAGGFAMRSFARILSTDPGFRTGDVVTARVSLSPARYPRPEDRAAFFARVCDALHAQPGVLQAAAISMLPLTGQTNDWGFGVEGHTPPSPGMAVTEQSRVVAGDYFTLVDIPLVRGRLFDERDSASAPRVAIVSEMAAQKYWSDGNPIGRRIRRWGLDSDEPWTTVVGIVGDIRHRGLMAPQEPFIYYPAAQLPGPDMAVLARIDPSNPRGAGAIEDAVRAVDRDQPIWSVRSMDDWRVRSVAEPRFSLVLLVIFAVLASVLASVGVYGVLAFSVAQRTRELGIRLALGARPAGVLCLVMREAALLSAAGIALGAGAGIAAGGMLRSIFADVRTTDPAVLAGVPGLVLLVALAAAFIPARRAMRVDPVEALRSE